MKVLDRTNETMRNEEMEQFKLERLQALLARLRRNVRRYRDMPDNLQVKSLDDLPSLPDIGPKELADAFPYGMFALPLSEVIRMNSLVGPDGRQLVTGHTRNDLVAWARLTARQLFACGVSSHDVIQICFGNGVFKEALGYLLGAEHLEASVIPEDTFHVDYQLAMLQNYRVTALVTTPTNASELVRLLDEHKIGPQSLGLRTILLSRPVPNDEREHLKTGLFAEIKCNFGVHEIMNPGMCVECEKHRFHVNEDQFLVEEENDELIVTTLCREAMPVLRYRTGVSCSLIKCKCECGRTGIVIEPGKRLDNRMRIGETMLYPAQIAAALETTRAAGFAFQSEADGTSLVVSIEMDRRIFGDTLRELENVRDETRRALSLRLGVDVEIKLVEHKS